MARKLRKSTISDLMATWGRKGGSRKTEAQRNASLENLKKTPNYRKHAQLLESQPTNGDLYTTVESCGRTH